MVGVPGAGGPVPKRSDQRRRRNKPPIDVDHGVAIDCEVPPASESWHPLARDWFLSLARSGQAAFYQASDWELARVAAETLTRAFGAEKLNSQLVTAFHAMATELLTTEGARRRLRIELERVKASDEDGGDVSWLDDARARLRGASG